MTILKKFYRLNISSHFWTIISFRWFIKYAPCFNPSLKRFIFPNLKCLMINNCRLNYFFAFKYSPSYSINFIILNILVLNSRSIYCLVWNLWIIIQELNQIFDHFSMDKKFKIWFLVNIAIIRAPSVLWICRFYSINFRLRIDCK
jgi:hypothetical protein